jgi:hypothetical protein
LVTIAHAGEGDGKLLFQTGAAFRGLEESKVVSSQSFMVNFKLLVRPVTFVFALLLFSAAAVRSANGQAFSLTTSSLSPATVDPGGSATASVDVMTSGGFTSTVDFACTVTSSQVTSNLPTCMVSPISVTPPANGPSLTVITTGNTPAGTYQITVTGTSGGTVETATPLDLNVTDLAEDYTITLFPTTAIPSPITAGNIATTTVTVAPLGTYKGTVSLSCLLITPAVEGAPVCTFSPSSVAVTGGTPPTSTLTITTFNTTVTPVNARLFRPRMPYAFWLGIPAFVFLGVRAAGKHRSKFLGIFLLAALAGGVLFLPACGSTTTNATNQITPDNTYTITVTGTDQNGIGPGSTATATVTLQVTSP